MKSKYHGPRGVEPRDVARSATRGGEGAQPSITAPGNSIRVIRHGIDSLYVSFPGTLDPDAAIALEKRKQFAQNSDERFTARAFIEIADHFFTVLPRGRGRYAYVIEDGWFSIQLSSAVSLPMAYVQIRSEYLTAVGAEEAIRTVCTIIREFGECSAPSISRVDLFADFIGDHDLPTQPGFAWVKRCRKRDIHEEGDRINGISFGLGNEVSARLYDKTLEITKSLKNYLKPLWAAQGWQEGQTVWRMEFQARREAFPEPLAGIALDALPHMGAWWQYLATEWLRLAIPSETDDTRSRWPTHPVWEAIAKAWDVPSDAPLMTRVDKRRAPSDEILFKHGIWGLSSFMAREGITDVDEGLGEFLHALGKHFETVAGSGGLAAYLETKVRSKARMYNSRVPGDVVDDDGDLED